MTKDLTWNKLLYGYTDKLLKFVINANLLTLPSPDNIKRWNLSDNVPNQTSPSLTSSLDVLGYVMLKTRWSAKMDILGDTIVFFYILQSDSIKACGDQQLPTCTSD